MLCLNAQLEYAPKNASKPLKGKKKGSKKGGKKSAAKKAAKGMSFLAEEVIVGGVKQWALVRHDHFQSADSVDGMQTPPTTTAQPTSTGHTTSPAPAPSPSLTPFDDLFLPVPLR